MIKTRLNHRRNAHSKGSAIIEATFVLILGIVILLGIMDIGQMLLAHQVLIQRVRAGVRYAVVHEWDADPVAAANRIKNLVLYEEDDPTPRTDMGLFGIMPDMVSVTRADPGGTPDDEGADRIVVAINDYRFFLLTPGITGEYTANQFSHSIPIENVENLGVIP